FGIELPLRTMFEASTVAALAAQVEQALGGKSYAAPPIRRRGREGELPLSFALQRLWFINQLDPGDIAYNVPGGLRIEGLLDLEALKKALTALVQRHESLRTYFVAIEGAPRQIIDPEAQFEMPLIDISGWPEAKRQAETQRLTLEGAQRPFDLGCGPLLRVSLLRRAAEDHVLLVTMHHIISDG